MCLHVYALCLYRGYSNMVSFYSSLVFVLVVILTRAASLRSIPARTAAFPDRMSMAQSMPLIIVFLVALCTAPESVGGAHLHMVLVPLYELIYIRSLFFNIYILPNGFAYRPHFVPLPDDFPPLNELSLECAPTSESHRLTPGAVLKGGGGSLRKLLSHTQRPPPPQTGTRHALR